MEVRISRDVLLNAVHKVQGIVEPKGAMPILSHLHLSAKKENIIIRATDLEIGTLGFEALIALAKASGSFNCSTLSIEILLITFPFEFFNS